MKQEKIIYNIIWLLENELFGGLLLLFLFFFHFYLPFPGSSWLEDPAWLSRIWEKKLSKYRAIVLSFSRFRLPARYTFFGASITELTNLDVELYSWSSSGGYLNSISCAIKKKKKRKEKRLDNKIRSYSWFGMKIACFFFSLYANNESNNNIIQRSCNYIIILSYII